MKPLWPLLLIMLVALGLYLACWDALQVGQSVDDASYVTLGQALASGRGYHLICYPGAPVETKYPPLLPLLLVPFLKLFHGALWATRLPGLLCTLGAIPVLWALLRRFVVGPALWALVALVAVHPMVVGFAGMPMTEAPSLLLTWSALLLVLTAADGNARRRYVAAGVVMGLALLLRSDAVALLAAVVVWLAATRRWQAVLLVGAPALVLFAPWLWHVAGAGPAVGQWGYLQETTSGWWDPSPLPLRLWHGFAAYTFGYVPEAVTLVFGGVVERVAQSHGAGMAVTAAQALVGLVVLLGFGRSWRRLPAVIALLVALRLGLLSAFCPVSRYLLPLLPFLLLYLALGLEALSLRTWRQRPEDGNARPIPARLLLVLCVLVLLPALARDGLLRLRPPRDQYPDVVAAGRLITAHTPADAVVLTNWSGKSFALNSAGRLFVEPERGTEQGGPEGLLDRAPQGRLATHLLLVTAPTPVDVAPYVASPRLQLVAQQPDRSQWLFTIRR